MANSMEMPELQSRRILGMTLAPTLVVFASLGCLASSVLLLKVVPIFDRLFKGLQVQLPFATRVLVADYRWIAILFAGGAVLLPIVMEFLISGVRRRLIVAGWAFALSSGSVALTVLIMYLPLLELARKLGQAK